MSVPFFCPSCEDEKRRAGLPLHETVTPLDAALDALIMQRLKGRAFIDLHLLQDIVQGRPEYPSKLHRDLVTDGEFKASINRLACRKMLSVVPDNGRFTVFNDLAWNSASNDEGGR